jgi:hypothetical protein
MQDRKKDIKPINDKGQARGYWESYWNDGILWYKCFYVNDVIYGYEVINSRDALDRRSINMFYYAR